MSKCLFIFLILFLSIDCMVENVEYVYKDITPLDVIHKEVSKKGTVIVNVDNGFNTTRKVTVFKANITNNEQNYTINCGFFAGKMFQKH